MVFIYARLFLFAHVPFFHLFEVQITQNLKNKFVNNILDIY